MSECACVSFTIYFKYVLPAGPVSTSFCNMKVFGLAVEVWLLAVEV